MKFYTVKDHGHTYQFYFNHYFSPEILNTLMVLNVEVMLEQTLNDSV
jgi:hypothetical protein